MEVRENMDGFGSHERMGGTSNPPGQNAWSTQPLQPQFLDVPSAAKWLGGISTRTLFNLTYPKGALRPSYFGRRKFFAIDELPRFAASCPAQHNVPGGAA